MTVTTRDDGIVEVTSEFYTALAGVVNETWKRSVLPVWKI